MSCDPLASRGLGLEPAAPEPMVATEAQPPDLSRLADRAYRTCPACGTEMLDRGCKLRCPREGCGFFLSCADFY